MGQNWGYENLFDVIISNQPYWNYHSFLSAWVDLLPFSVPVVIRHVKDNFANIKSQRSSYKDLGNGLPSPFLLIKF